MGEGNFAERESKRRAKGRSDAARQAALTLSHRRMDERAREAERKRQEYRQQQADELLESLVIGVASLATTEDWPAHRDALLSAIGAADATASAIDLP